MRVITEKDRENAEKAVEALETIREWGRVCDKVTILNRQEEIGWAIQLICDAVDIEGPKTVTFEL